MTQTRNSLKTAMSHLWSRADIVENKTVTFNKIQMCLTSVSVAPLVLLAELHWGHICFSSPLSHSRGMSQHAETRQAVVNWVWNKNRIEKSSLVLLRLEHTQSLWERFKYERVFSAGWDGELDALLLWLDDNWASSSDGEGEGLSCTRSYA